MKQSIRTVEWKFCDAISRYSDLPWKEERIIRTPADVFTAFQFLFDAQVRERFVVVWLSSSNRVTGFEVISEGTLNTSVVHPREVFRGAIVATCASVIIAHNHPSGNPEPSREDQEITRQLVEAGKIIGIPVHDHIIFAEDGYTSFAERGIM